MSVFNFVSSSQLTLTQYICNHVREIFPDSLTISIVNRLYKKRWQKYMTNYWTISLFFSQSTSECNVQWNGPIICKLKICPQSKSQYIKICESKSAYWKITMVTPKVMPQISLKLKIYSGTWKNSNMDISNSRAFAFHYIYVYTVDSG